MAKRPRIALIDADSILYAQACASEARAKGQSEEGSDLYFPVRDAEAAYKDVVKRLQEVTEAVGAEDALICLTTTKCFRYDLLPTYKAHRVDAHRPAMLQDLQRMVQERRPYGVLCVRGIEADDVCGISSGHLRDAGLKEPVICSIDKDLLSIPGLTYSTRKAAMGVYEVSQADADRAFLYQTLVGDVTDNYTGCPGVGPKKATAILDQCAGATLGEQWRWTLQAFTNRGHLGSYALTQARVARILRSSDWDAATKAVLLWEPPQQAASA
jgi:5'-3' exonuclease